MSLFGFFSWHYSAAWQATFRVWFNFVAFGLHIFSVPLLIKTLFDPWHRIYSRKKKPGFSFTALFDRITLDLVSRTIGFGVRLILITCGLILTLFYLLLGFCLVIVWPFLPFVSWIIYWHLNPKQKSDKDLLNGEAKKFVMARLGIDSLEKIKYFDRKDVMATIHWYKKLKGMWVKRAKFWKKENLLSTPAMGSDLAFGFTPNMDKFCLDLAESPPFPFHLVGRKAEVKQLETVLSLERKHNAVMVGEPGVGKHAILMGLARAIAAKQISPRLFYHRLLLLNVNEVIGQSKDQDEAKEKLNSLFKESRAAGNVIIVIKDIANFISNKQGHNFTDVFTRAARHSKLRFLVVAEPIDFDRYIQPNEHFLKYFQKVEVKSRSPKDALDLLQRITPDFEYKKEVVVTYPALKEIINQSDQFITDIPFPEKAVDLLEGIIRLAESKGKKYVGVREVETMISQKLKIPIGSISADEKEKLLKLDKLLAKRVVGQKEAIQSLTDALQRGRLSLSERQKPLASFLFLGPTGVGKTETAKALAQAYFGSAKQLVRFDMAEYQGSGAVTALIGSGETGKPGFLTQAIRDKPYGVYLFDEFEKTAKAVHNLFLTILDEGYLKDHNNKTLSFRSAIILCTSNAAGEFIRETLKKQPNIPHLEFQNKVIEHCLAFGFFSPELVNRFDGVVIYKPLTKKEIKEIAARLLVQLQTKMKKKKIKILIDPAVIDFVVVRGYDLHFGARSLQRVLAREIESPLAKAILMGKIKKGDLVKICMNKEGKKVLLQ
jgi:ATP-dependent Clp protease ATP-binding subunit ClpA